MQQAFLAQGGRLDGTPVAVVRRLVCGIGFCEKKIPLFAWMP